MVTACHSLFTCKETVMDFGGVVVGLGNPGNQYAGTRHNCGFAFVESLLDHARREGGQVQSQNGGKFSCELWRLRYDGLPGDWLAAMPQTFMNLSGESVRAAADFYKVDPDHIIVVYDDVSLDVGQLRIRTKGSAGGHNGIKNIIAHLGTQEFPRIKVGVGNKPPRMDLADYVLGRFPKEERGLMEDAFKEAAEAVEVMIKEGAGVAMNRFNGHKEKE